MRHALIAALALLVTACPAAKDEQPETDDGARDSATGETGTAPKPQTDPAPTPK